MSASIVRSNDRSFPCPRVGRAAGPRVVLFVAVAWIAAAFGPAARADAPANDEWCYRWAKGEHYSYRISCSAKIDDIELVISGTNTYSLGRPLDGRGFGGEFLQGSGTAFVVSADGYLVTCNHVVHRATDVKATIGGKSMPCEVVAVDASHDLALLHVARKDLSPLPLADSDRVELAEEVRAAGFPLSDMLGSDLKITRGSIAGISSKHGGKTFQIDASVNPGNSGGPLLDGRGAVVGVVNAQLVGFQISKVGFAVPINYAKRLLAKKHVAFQKPGETELDGPTLAKRIAPALAFVNVSGHGDDAFSSEGGEPTVHFHGVFDRSRKTSDDGDDENSRRWKGSDREDGNLKVDERGEITGCDGHLNLPCLLGSVGAVAIEPLPNDDEQKERTWKREDVVTVVASGPDSEDPLGGIRPAGFPERDTYNVRGPFWGPREITIRYPVKQAATYSATTPKDGVVVIHKRLEIRSVEGHGTPPRLELVGAGDIVFDLRAGLPKKINFSGKFAMRQEGETLEVPVTLVCERVAETATVAVKAKSSKKAATSKAAVSSEDAKAANAQLDELLADLRAEERDWNKCFQALQALSLIQPVASRRNEVANVLNVYLTDRNVNARSAAVVAARKWASPRNVPALVRLLDPSESTMTRRRVIEILGGLGDARAAKPIAERLRDPMDRKPAARALRALGKVAEPAVVALLADESPSVRGDACALLGDIGGAKSVAALKKIAESDASTTVQDAAQRALEKIEKPQ